MKVYGTSGGILLNKESGQFPVQIKKENGSVLNHVAIIMDGNGRWAQKQGLPRTAGHKQGMETVKEIAKASSKRGIKVLTLYAFSTENWKRPLSEVHFLMQLPIDFFQKFMPEIQENNIKVEVTGFSERIPAATTRVIQKAVHETATNTGMILNFALNYGGRAELVNAAREIAEKVKNQDLKVSSINEELFEQHLLTRQLGEYQDVDLLIRTSGEERLSNFLLWQNAYSEFYFTSLSWPEFDEAALNDAFAAYQGRGRRFGGVNSSEH